MKMISAGLIKNKYEVKIFFLLIIILFSCTSNTLFEKNCDIYNSSWNKKELISFEVPINDTTSHYNFFINVRNNTDYDFCNLYLFMNTIYPDKQVSKDTIECLIADSKGKWFGKGWGKYRFISLLLGKGIQFPQKGTYIFEFEQAMRKDTLENIAALGIKIEKTSLSDKND